MPIYEYECKSCGAQISKFLPITNTTKSTTCPTCKKQAKKIISKIGGFIFKGPGFYATDYQGK